MNAAQRFFDDLINKGVYFKIKRGTSDEWAASGVILRDGEPGYDITLRKLKIGDGFHRWVDLDFVIA